MKSVQNHDVKNIRHKTGSRVLSIDDSRPNAHFVAGNEVLYGHILCVLQKTRRSICHPRFVVQNANTKKDYFSVGVQIKSQKKIWIRIWGDKNLAWTYWLL